jgi:endonuclease G
MEESRFPSYVSSAGAANLQPRTQLTVPIGIQTRTKAKFAEVHRNFIGAQADEELFCIFAGPVLASDDELFSGKDLSGTVKVAIPKRFWKVVCALKEKKLQVFAFLLEQDLTGLPLEFQVNAEWKERMISLKKLEQTVKLLKFQKLYHNADQGK